MKLVDYLKNKKERLLELKKQEKDNNGMDDIKILIEYEVEAFENEDKFIKDNAKIFVENGITDNYEDAIISAATMIHGLKYLGKAKDENNNTVLFFKDVLMKEIHEK